MSFNQIKGEAALKLEDVFTLEEVFMAVLELNGDKPRVRMVSRLLFGNLVGIFFKEEMMGFSNEFHAHDSFVRSLNSTFLVLIPKREDAVDLKDFRPISLIGGLYKILAKVLANKLKMVVGKVVSEAQNAFVEGRQTLDAALVANKVVNSILRRKEYGLLCKLNIKEEYDHIDWDFLLGVMTKMGFGSKWVSWINWCISKASFSIMVNGSSFGFFRSSKGLRQGDLLSPYLFVISMETLSFLIARVVDGGYIFGCRVGCRDGEELVISHLLYADDTLLLCEPSQDQLAYLS